MKKNKLFPKGFTLIEMLIVVMIILLVLSIGGNTYRNQRKYIQFTDSLVKVNSMIKTARNYTVTSRSVYDDCQTLPEDRAYVPANGYGVYISRSDTPGLSRFVLFANTKTEVDEDKAKIAANQFDETADPCQSDLIEEEYFLPMDVDFIELSTDRLLPDHTPIKGKTTNDKAVIIFSPPLADASIAANDNPQYSENLVFLDDLYMHFRRPDSDPSIPSYYIHINHIAGFPETEIKQ